MRRLGIFLFYDGDGRVSPHIHTSIKAFSPHFEELIFVANGKLNMRTYAGLEPYVTYLLRRENVGFDVWGYKAGIEHVGYSNLEKYDEIVLLNYTFFAPVTDLGEMFSRMEQRQDLDGWGMTEYSDAGKTFLQSYFLCSRKSLHSRQDYRNYWQTMPEIKSINDSLDYHEFRFSRYFRDLGYKLESYVENRKDWDGNTTLTDIDGLIDGGMPVIKYRSFNFDPDIVEARGGRKMSANFDLVRDRTDYPVEEVWNYIINQTSPDDLIASAELCRIVGSAPIAKESVNLRVLVTLEDPSTLNLVFERLDRIGPERVMIFADDPEIRAAALSRGYEVRDKDVLRISLRRAKENISGYHCSDDTIIHLSDFLQERSRYFFKESLFINYWDPLLSSDALNWVSSEKHIGLVFPFPDAVSGISSFKHGTGSSLGNWKSGFRPDYLRKAAHQHYWPWRGNFVIRSELARDPGLQKCISEMLDSIIIRENEKVAGPEGAMPELARRLGFASGIVVPETEAKKLLLRSAFRSRINEKNTSQLAQKFRNEIRIIGKQNLQKSVPDFVSEPAPMAVTAPIVSDEQALPVQQDFHKLQPYEFSIGGQREVFRSNLSLRYFFESWDVLPNLVSVTGWAFDSRYPHDLLQVGLVAGDTFVAGPEPFSLSRPDVLEAFSSLSVADRSGFEVVQSNSGDEDFSKYSIAFLNMSKNSVCLIPLVRKRRRGIRRVVDAIRSLPNFRRI